MADVSGLQQYVASGVRIAVNRREDETTIHLEGEVDLANKEQVRETVFEAIQQRPARLTLDLSRLSFMDSSGVHVLREATQQSAEKQTSLRIVPGPPPVQRVFEICELTSVLPFRFPGQE